MWTFARFEIITTDTKILTTVKREDDNFKKNGSLFIYIQKYLLITMEL